jgi:carboxypeptidase Q
MIAPRQQDLNILGLGTTIGTPRGGIIADVVAVESFQEFNALPDDLIKGKIIVFAPKWVSYDKTVEYRLFSAKVAGKRGAVATLVRSVTPFSLNPIPVCKSTTKRSTRFPWLV